VARRRAEQLGVDLSLLTPSGPEGVISLADVERAVQAKPTARPAADKLTAMRQAIAAAMAKSKREIPHYYLGATIDVSRAASWLEHENAKRPVTQRVLFAALLLKAVAVALKEVPELNGFWVDGGFKPVQAVHLGIGIGLRGGGLVAPAIRDANEKSLLAMMEALSNLVTRARGGTLRSSELSDATVTVTNLGEQGVETVYGVIYPPQVALVGFGKVVERPWAENGGLYVRRLIHATLCADHRASVGHRGALFLSALDRMLQEPEKL
jgi:pyruvate dehydrogenase E2 component (dihydrolipoamide acetyltransferase)